MTRHGALAIVILLASCAAPDVAPDIADGRKLLTGLQTSVGPAITRAADADFRATEDRMIADGKAVVQVVGNCSPAGTPPATSLQSDCQVVSLVPPPGDTSARSVREFLAVVDAYLDAIDGLASSASVDEARRQADALVAAFGAPSADRPRALEAVAEEVRARRTLIVEGTGLYLDQVRVAGLRRVVRRAAPLIEQGVPLAADYLQELDPALERAQEAHDLAALEVLDAEESGNAGRHRAAVDDLRKRNADLVATQAASPAVQMRAFGVVHARLADVVRRPGTLTRIVGVLETLRKLRDSAR